MRVNSWQKKHSALFGIICGMEKSGEKNLVLVGTSRPENANVSRHLDAVGRVNLGNCSLLTKSENPKSVKVRAMKETATKEASERPANETGNANSFLSKPLPSDCRNVVSADSHFFKKVRIGSASSRRTRRHCGAKVVKCDGWRRGQVQAC